MRGGKISPLTPSVNMRSSIDHGERVKRRSVEPQRPHRPSSTSWSCSSAAWNSPRRCRPRTSRARCANSVGTWSRTPPSACAKCQDAQTWCSEPSVAGMPSLSSSPRAMCASRGFMYVSTVTRSVKALLFLHDGLAGDRVGKAESSAEVFEHGPHVVEVRDHRGPGVDDALHAVPLADDAIRPLPGLDQGEAMHAREVPLHVPMLFQECLLLALFDAKAHDVECGHG